MGLFRYIVQGFGWEIGSQAAREGIRKVGELNRDQPERQPSKRQLAKLARARQKQEAAERKRRAAEAARRQARIEDQLRDLKAKSKS
jgi:hypothetical protein